MQKINRRLVGTEEAADLEIVSSRQKAEGTEPKTIDTNEAMEIANVDARTIQRWFKDERIKGHFVDGQRAGKGGQKLMIDEESLKRYLAKKKEKAWIPDQVRNDNLEESHPDRYKIHRGEPGCRVVTQFKDGMPMIQKAEGSRQNAVEKTPNLPAISSPSPRPSPARGEGKVLETPNLPSIINDMKQVPAKCNRIANLRYALLQAFQNELTKPDPNLPLFNSNNGHRSKTKIIQRFLDLYNSGILLPEIHGELESISRATLYNWLQAYDQNGIAGLVPAYGGQGISKVTQAEIEFLYQFLLEQNHPKIADAIRRCKYYLGDKSPSSPATLRRYVNTFKSQFHDVWTLDREGQKAWNDKVAPYQDRAWWTLQVGEILVADGHKLNFKVINPHTGKESRAVLIMFWDWYSSYPVGWEVMLTENVQCVATALRNAILTLGKIPQCIYLDNGKAFKAKCFTKKIILEETELPGIFERLGVDVIWAMKYNAQAKPLERIFGVLEWLERQIDSFVGNSINDKPANLKPNEPRAKKLRGNYTPKIDQVNDLIRQWRDFYAIQPLRGRHNQTARELFEPGRGSGVDPKALCFLMMKAEIKGIRRKRITFDGFDWTGDCLYGLKMSRALVRYSHSDRSQVYVFDLKDQIIGVVEPIEPTAPRDHEAARRIVAERRHLIRQTKALSNMAKTASPEMIDLISRKNPNLLEYIQQEETKKEQPRLSPFVHDDNAPQAVYVPIPEAPESESGASASAENGRPLFWSDHEKYDWLMKQSSINAEDRVWVDEFTSRSSLYKNLKAAGGKE